MENYPSYKIDSRLAWFTFGGMVSALIIKVLGYYGILCTCAVKVVNACM
jgi:hypothetical protein